MVYSEWKKMKGKKQRQKVIPHCYKRNLSRTLSNSSTSQLIQIGSYKKRINDLSRNNRHLAVALQDSRIEAAVQSDMLKDCAKDCNKLLLARLKLNEMAKDLTKFVTDLEEVGQCLDIDILSDKNPFMQKKGSPKDKIYKKPAINCIEEVSENSSVNSSVVSENVSAVPDPTASHTFAQKKSDVPPRTSDNNIGFINEEDMEIAPILFTEESEEKKKKNSSKSRDSKMSFDPDKGSMTPELNIDLTCVKLKRKSSRRQTHFKFSGLRSTSKGKNSSVEKENSPEELVAPAMPASPVSSQQDQDASKIKQTIEAIFKSSMSNNIKENLCENQSSVPENHTKTAIDANRLNFSNVCAVNPAKNLKTVVTSEVHPIDSNHTVLLCEDMELTEVIRPGQIIVGNAPPFANPSCDITKEPKENTAFASSSETDNVDNKRIASEKNSLELFIPHQDTCNLPNNDELQVPKINEDDEVQNVGEITFCESNENVGSRTSKSSLIRNPRRSKAVKYATFFSSDESDGDSSFEINTKKTDKCNRKTVVSNKIGKHSEKNLDTINHHEVFSESENKLNDNLIKCTVDALRSEKERIAKTHKHTKITEKIGSSEKGTASSKERNLKLSKNENVKKIVPSHEKAQKSKHSHENPKKLVLSHENDKKSRHAHDENVKKSVLSHDNDNKSKHNHESAKMPVLNHDHDKKSKHDHGNAQKLLLSHDNDKNSKQNQENVKKFILGRDNDKKLGHKHENAEKLLLTHSNDKKSGNNHENAKKLILTHDNGKKSKQEIAKNYENTKKLKLGHDTDKKLGHHKENVKKPTLGYENVEKLMLTHDSDKKSEHNNKSNKLFQHCSEPVKQLGLNLENTKKTEQRHENIKSLVVFSPGFSPGGILGKTQTNVQFTKEMGTETPSNKAVSDDDLNDRIFDEIKTPMSESGKVSFAPTDLVCNFKKLSVSKKIAKNKKVRRTSKSVLDFEELLEEKTKEKDCLIGAYNVSEDTNMKKTDNPVFDFSGDTELYNFKFSSDSNSPPVLTTDDLMLRSTSSISSQKDSNKISKHSKNLISLSRPIKTTEKLSLKRTKSSQPQLISEQIFEEGSPSIRESPISIPKSVKRKSLFMDDLDNSKENIDHLTAEKPKKILQEKDKTHTNGNLVLTAQDNCLKKSTGSKRQSKAQGKNSLKKLSQKKTLVERASDAKKKLSMAVRSLEDSPVLRDTINLQEDEITSKRRKSKQVSYKEPSLNKKLRRE